MQIFINEASLHEQYEEQYHFFESFKIFISSIKKIGEIKKNKDVFKSDHFYYYCGLEGEIFQSTLKNNFALNQAFVQNFQMLNAKSWQKEQIHDSNCSYEFKNESYENTSVAEISERSIVINNFSGFLLNFVGSKFGNETTLQIKKNKDISIRINTLIDPEQIESWLISEGYIDPNQIYDENSKIAPSDFQTVLRDSSIFLRTNHPRNKGRVVYKRIGTSELWTVDGASKHAGPKAHIEIFDENTTLHLGTSLYNKIELDSDYKVPNRKITLV